MDTELGYSITCHASMYSGVRPDTHKIWFLWRRDQERSPYAWTQWFRPVPFLDNTVGRALAAKVTRRFGRSSAFSGLPAIHNMSLRHWCRFAPSETVYWTEDGYFDGRPSMFEWLRQQGVATATRGIDVPRPKVGLLAPLEHGVGGEDGADLLYVFVGEYDSICHFHGKGSAIALDFLARLDRYVAALWTRHAAAHPGSQLLLWSDHGQALIERRLEIYGEVRRRGLDLQSIPHIVDTNYLRLWPGEQENVVRWAASLTDVPGLRWLSETDERKYRVPLSTCDYGQLVGYLDYPYAFAHTAFGFGRRVISIHGYDPHYDFSKGVALSTESLSSETVALVDVFPTITSLLGVDEPRDLEGSARL